MVEVDDRVNGKLFARVAFEYQKALVEVESGSSRRHIFKRQAELVNLLSEISKETRISRISRPKKIERLRQFLSDPKNSLLSFQSLPLPLDANKSVTGVRAEECSVFKSSLLPLLIYFTCEDGSEYPIIFKTGDDLRQDQLVIQMVSLMDNLLLKENLNLKLTPYRILAMSVTQGAVQFIESITLNAALASHHGSLLAYLKHSHPGGTVDTYGIKPEALDNYVKSCAGYCVITYILGVGDRHLDNLLIASDGRFFHADFGYILGRDPKPYPPQMKLSREMVEGMGGIHSPHYEKFRGYCFTAFSTLRKSANLILNLFSLMIDASIRDIQIEPDKAVPKVKEKFCLELSEEDAVKHFQGLIDDSLGAMLPQVIDRLHNWTQYLKS